MAAIAILGLPASSVAMTAAVSPQVRSDLAPTGKLRVGINYGNRLFARRGPDGEGYGIAVDLARELGRRTGLPVQWAGYDSGGRLTAGLKAGGWDVAFLAYEQSREDEIAYGAHFAEIDATYLVPAGSSLRNAAEVDREGVRIPVSDVPGGVGLFVSHSIKRARLVTVKGDAFKVFVAERMDALPGLKPTLLEQSATLPGSRVLDGRFTVIPYSVGTVKGRDAGARYLRDFIEDAKASGFVASSIEKNGIKGVSVAASANR